MSDFEDLFDSIKKIALEHEEPYKIGSWETFSEKRKKKKSLTIWPFIISGLAATLIIGLFIAPQILDNENIKESSQNSSSRFEFPEIIPLSDTTTTKIIKAKKKTKPEQLKKEITKTENINVNTVKQDKTIINPKELEKEKAKNEIQLSEVHQIEKYTYEKNDSITIVSNDSVKESKQQIKLAYELIKDFEEETSKKGKRLKFGFLISPLMTSNKEGSNVGISTGIQTYVPISGIVSVSSGLTFSHQKIENVYTNHNSINQPVLLTSSLFSFDIPINLKINLKKTKNRESYLLAGISSVGYLSERNTYTYKHEEIAQVITEIGGQEVTTFQTIMTEKSIEKNESPFSSFDFAGFLNISYGIKSSFTKNTYITFAPFVKLPLSNLTSNNLKYACGGMSLIISK